VTSRALTAATGETVSDSGKPLPEARHPIISAVTRCSGSTNAVSIGYYGDTMLHDQRIGDTRPTFTSLASCVVCHVSSATTASSSSWVRKHRSVPFGKYCRSSLLALSLVPRYHGECGSQK
jgi:hypothetical protein